MRPDDLAALVIAEAVERAGVPPGEIEDVWLGCANQAGEDNRNVARFAALLAGLPDSVAGVTVNRLCASGLSAVVGACQAVIAGDGDLFVAGGVESMTPRAVRDGEARRAVRPRRPHPVRHDARLALRQSALRGAVLARNRWARRGRTSPSGWDVSREDQDAFAARSQARWAAAQEAGRFADELVAVGDVEHDEHPRPGTTIEKLATLKTAFRPGGTVTAGNASGINDGAAALVIASEERATALGVEPLGAFVGSAVAGVDPAVMGIGPDSRGAQASRAARGRVDEHRSGRAERGIRVAVARRRSVSSGWTRSAST